MLFFRHKNIGTYIAYFYCFYCFYCYYSVYSFYSLKPSTAGR